MVGVCCSLWESKNYNEKGNRKLEHSTPNILFCIFVGEI